MAICVHCGARKGERGCPALGGDICARCCGKHRLVDIGCPGDCRWLGGLAALRAAPQRFTREDEDGAFRRLVAFTESARELATGRDAFCAMLGVEARPLDDELAEMTDALDEQTAAAITVHLAYGHRAADGTRAVDRFIPAHGRDLARGEAAAMVAMQRARAALVTVVAAQVGVGMVLRDRVTGDTVTVPTTPGDMPRMGTSMFVWLLDNAGTWLPGGPMIMIPPVALPAVTERLKALVDAAPEADRRAVLAAAAPTVLAVLRAHAAASPEAPSAPLQP